MSHIQTTSRKRPNCPQARRRAFTLIELTIVMLIIGILVGLSLSVFAAAYEQSRAARTRAIISKIDQFINEKYESYRTRPVPIRIPPTYTPDQAAAFRLNAIRELMRMEMPDRITDVTAGPVYFPIIPSANYVAFNLAALPTRPALNKQYLRRGAQAHQPGNPGLTGIDQWTTPNENAECLYLILALIRDGEKSALDFFAPTEIGDVDGDGMNEILDSWGQPIAFLRWAPGYRADVFPNPVTTQTGAEPDPFDPLRIDGRWRDNVQTNNPFALKPLIWSAGPDKRHDIGVGGPYAYTPLTSPPNDPYVSAGIIGMPSDTNSDGYPDYTDNITNHDLEAR